MTELTMAEILENQLKRRRLVPRLNDPEQCGHFAYQGMEVHGRCCPLCGKVMIDFGD